MGTDNKEIVHGRVKNGWLHFDRYFEAALVEFCKAHENMKVWITIVAGNARSIAQNSYFHGPFIGASVRATGDTDRVKWKGFYKELFLRVPDGRGGYYTQSTADLTVQQFSKFLGDATAWSIDNIPGWHLTEPEHREYVTTLGPKDRDVYKWEKEQGKLPW